MRNLLTPCLVMAILGVSLLGARADATLTCALTGAGSANTGNIPYVVSDADGLRILNAAIRAYSPIIVAPALPPTDQICIDTPQDARCLPINRPATSKEAITSLIKDWQATIGRDTASSDKINAATSAANAVTPIVPK